MRKLVATGLLFSIALVSFAQSKLSEVKKSPFDYVNVFIGTGEAGNTYPAAQAPFGMISIGPSNTFKNYDSVSARSGYKYSQDQIRGFSLTHFSGVGCHAMQDLLFLPVAGELNISPVNNKDGYKSLFSHSDEKANPGFYKVKLKDYKIDVRFAADKRSAIGEVIYHSNEKASVIFAPTNSANGISNGSIKIDKINNRLSGYVTTGGFCWRDPAYLPYTIYYVTEFDTQIDDFGVWKASNKISGRDTVSGKDIAAYISFSRPGVKKVNMRTAISFVSVENAMLNLKAEIPHWNLEKVQVKTSKSWISYLNRLVVEGGSEDEKALFYTSVYHNLLQANIFEDVNKEYIGFDDKIHKIEPGRSKYVNFSLWDTYRTTAYLQAIIAPKESSDMINSLLLDAQQGGAFPNWSMNNQEYGVMNGYSPFPFIANMYAMGAKDFNLGDVKEMMKKVSQNYYPNRGKHGWLNLEEYKKLGFVPVNKNGFGTSMTMEYGIDDYSIAKICEAAGDKEAMQFYLNRSQNIFNLYNPKTGLLQGKNSDGTFITPFQNSTEKGFNEGNAIQYFWSVPHSIRKLIVKAGGKEVVEKRLDQFISRIETGWAPEKPYYWLGNEPCFGTAYVYNYLQTPWKAQYHVRRIMTNYFKNTPDGLSGDDDSGAMSALYVFSALGLYPYLPGEPGFTVTGPLFQKITFNLNNGKKILIKSKTAKTASPYIQSMKVNGKEFTSLWLSWNDLSKGAILEFDMGDKENKSWGNAKRSTPPSYFPDLN